MTRRQLPAAVRNLTEKARDKEKRVFNQTVPEHEKRRFKKKKKRKDPPVKGG